MRAFALAFALALPVAASAASPVSTGEILSRGASGVGYSYWWGHGRWDAGSVSWPGGCSGSCGACSHYPSRNRNDGTRERGPEMGADCSGFVAKAWKVPDSNVDTQTDAHPYSTRDFNVDKRGYWRTVRDVQPGDARVRRSGGGGHIYLVESVGARGSLGSMEANGCRKGILRMPRSVGESGYHTIRREGLTADENRPPDVAERPRGRGTAAVGQDVNVCTRATDPDRDQVRYHLVASTAAGAEVMRVSTPLVRSGTEMCATVRFDRPGRYVVEARSQDEHEAYASARSAALSVVVEAQAAYQTYDVELSYDTVPAQQRAIDGRTLDLDLLADLPSGIAGGGGTLRHDGTIGTIEPRVDAYPYAAYQRADCAGCTETLRLHRALSGEYVVWIYDYENAAQAEASMSRARARLQVFSVAANGARTRLYSFDAPGGTYNHWTAVRLRFDGNGFLTSAAAGGGTRSVNLY